MASGTITGTTDSYVYLKISWSSTKGTGGSTVNASLIAQNGTYSYWYATVNNGYSITIDGTKSSGTTAKLSTAEGGSSTLISASKWISYTGNKSITLSGTANMSNIEIGDTGKYIGNRSVSGTATLDKVGEKPPVPTVTAPTTSTISETATSITVTWAKSADYSGTATYTLQVSKNGGSYSTVKSSISNATVSYSYTITAGQGNTYRFRVCAVNDIGTSNYSYSGTVTTNNLTAPTIGEIAEYNPYVTATLSVPLSGGSQANSGAFKRMAALYHGSTLLATCTTPSNGNTTASITYAQGSYASRIGTTKYNDTFKIVAWTQNANGSKSSTVSKNFTVNLNSDGGAEPTLNAPTLTGGLSGYSSTCFIAGIHSLKVTSGSASVNRAPSGTTLSYSISCTGFSAVASNSATFAAPTAGKKTITVTVKDSRGLTATKTVYCRFQSWTKPTVKITSAVRDETTPTTIKVAYTVSYSTIYNTYGTDGDTAGTNINGISKQEYTTASSYTSCTSPISITNTSTDIGYTVKVRAYDKISSSEYGTTSRFVGTVNKYISFRDGMVGLGCVPAGGFRLDIKGGVRFYTDTGDIRFNNGNISNSGILQVKTAGSTIGSRRFNQTWTGYYDSNDDAVSGSNRRGWIGHSSTDSVVFQIVNEKGSAISLKTYVDGVANAGVSINHNALYPDSDNARACGYSNARWTNVYSTNGTINTSDRNHKKNINELDDKYVQLFNKLMPVSFEFNYKNSDRVHIGFISQDVEDAMNELGISGLEFAGFCKDVKQVYNEDTDKWTDVLDENGNPIYIYSLRYQEFIALNTYMIQKCMAKIDELEKQL